MSDIIRLFRQREEEQAAREAQRQMVRAARAGRQPLPDAPPVYTPAAKPLVPAGIQPVFVLNMPRSMR